MATPDIAKDDYRPGKEALARKDRPRVDCRNTRRLTGSIHLDKILQNKRDHAHKHRWDYGIGYKPPQGRERAIWIEVHQATTSEVRTPIDKLTELRAWLKEHAPSLQAITQNDESSFVWLATGSVNISPSSRQAKMLNQAGLGRPTKFLKLP